jgi:hypothetical protein
MRNDLAVAMANMRAFLDGTLEPNQQSPQFLTPIRPSHGLRGLRRRTLRALELTAVRGRRHLLISGSLVRVQLREPFQTPFATRVCFFFVTRTSTL